MLGTITVPFRFVMHLLGKVIDQHGTLEILQGSVTNLLEKLMVPFKSVTILHGNVADQLGNAIVLLGNITNLLGTVMVLLGTLYKKSQFLGGKRQKISKTGRNRAS